MLVYSTVGDQSGSRRAGRCRSHSQATIGQKFGAKETSKLRSSSPTRFTLLESAAGEVTDRLETGESWMWLKSAHYSKRVPILSDDRVRASSVDPRKNAKDVLDWR